MCSSPVTNRGCNLSPFMNICREVVGGSEATGKGAAKGGEKWSLSNCKVDGGSAEELISNRHINYNVAGRVPITLESGNRLRHTEDLILSLRMKREIMKERWIRTSISPRANE
ncbi:hypothetical protein TNCV_3724141 [Trichonephila clavipes]|nr:hypothetical protein TNCV_3724141 [Trichonephila clavipes]